MRRWGLLVTITVVLAIGLAAILVVVAEDDAGPDVSAERLARAPLTGRTGASGTWTGTEFVVFGGADDAVLADGAAYEPSTRQWRTLAPPPIVGRTRHAAVWTGQHVLVWGGSSTAAGGGDLLDGATFDPVSGSWREVPPAPPGSARAYASAVAVGEVVAIGGRRNPVVRAHPDILLYSLREERWTVVPLGGDVLDLAPIDGEVAVVSFEADQLEVAAVDAADGSVRRLPAPEHQGRPQAVGLASVDGSLVLGVQMGSGSVSIDRLDGDRWISVVDTDVDHFPLPIGLDVPAAGVLAGSGSTLLTFTPGAIGVVDLASGEALGSERLGAVHCGADAATAWTGATVIVWGGQNCTADRVSDDLGFVVAVGRTPEAGEAP